MERVDGDGGELFSLVVDRQLVHQLRDLLLQGREVPRDLAEDDPSGVVHQPLQHAAPQQHGRAQLGHDRRPSQDADPHYGLSRLNETERFQKK